MAVVIPEAFRDLLERPIVVTLATIMPDGSPQASPVWFSYDGARIWVNTVRGRQKERNMRARPQVTVLSTDPDDPYRYLEVRGIVVEVTEQGAVEHINSLSARYRGVEDFYSRNPSRRGRETRVIYKIEPVRIITH